jgi:hypothetical protein
VSLRRKEGANASGAATSDSIATAVTNLCIVDVVAEAASRGTKAASANETPATPRKMRPNAACGRSSIASPSRARPTKKIVNSIAHAAGNPGSASRLIVRCAGSYPGVTRPATTTTGTDRTGAATPRAATARIIGQR